MAAFYSALLGQASLQYEGAQYLLSVWVSVRINFHQFDSQLRFRVIIVMAFVHFSKATFSKPPSLGPLLWWVHCRT